MTSPAIRVQGLSKRYWIGAPSRPAGHLREALTDLVSAPFRRRARRPPASGEFWALRDVSLDVEHGEVLGVVGRNGAGKSTLLKIISRVTEPTAGRVELFGRVGSLLEVGTGFHPELTGRENIYLNGTILGMRKREIDRKFDEIVAFAEVGPFLDTPVKRYSSGMYVRLAFAVAAHLDTEIMLVDEVLAVGDADFQKKCLGKMGDVAQAGRTILFVSHNMAAVKALCRRAVWLDHGAVQMDGPAGEVVDAYLRALTTSPDSSYELSKRVRDAGIGTQLKITGIVLNHHEPLCHGQPVHMRIEYETTAECVDVSLGIGFSSLDGVRICTLDTDLTNPERPTIPAGTRGAAEVTVDYLDLQPATYLLDVGARSGDRYCLDYLGGCGQVEVMPGPATPTMIMRAEGGVRMRGQWTWNKQG